MKNKAKLAFDLLEQEMEVICKEDQVRFVGGSGGYTWQQIMEAINSGNIGLVPAGSYVMSSSGDSFTFFGGELNEVIVSKKSPAAGSSSGFVFWDWSDHSGGSGSFRLSSGGYVQGGGGSSGGGSSGGGSTGDGGYNPTNYELARDITAGAISTGLSFNEFYANMSVAIFSNTPVTANDLLKNIFDNNPAGSFVDDLRAVQQFKGIAILSLTGKLLGYSQAYDSLGTLKDDILDGGGVSAVNVADAAINVGSLFIKSNVVGLAVSGGWLLIKGQLDDQ